MPSVRLTPEQVEQGLGPEFFPLWEDRGAVWYVQQSSPLKVVTVVYVTGHIAKDRLESILLVSGIDSRDFWARLP